MPAGFIKFVVLHSFVILIFAFAFRSYFIFILDVLKEKKNI